MKTLDTAELGPIKIEPKRSMSRLDLLERVNNLNMKAAINRRREAFYTVTVLYNTVIYRHKHGKLEMYETITGVPK